MITNAGIRPEIQKIIINNRCPPSRKGIAPRVVRSEFFLDENDVRTLKTNRNELEMQMIPTYKHII